MRKVIATIATLATALSTLAFVPSVTVADSTSANFEAPTFTVGNIDGQDGWMKTGTFDAAVVANTYGYASFAGQSLRISDSVTSGSFGDQTFAKPVLNAAGEADSTDGTFSRGVLQPHFETQFDFASTQSTEQSGMHTSVSPDRGDGSRMSYLRFDDAAAGVNVFFDDVQQAAACTPSGCANFVETQIGTLSRSMPHTVKLSIDFVNGPSNDVVKVWIDGILVHTGTTWEDYYRFDPESNAEQSPRIVKTVLFRESGTANVADAGKGFLFDNLTISTGQVPNQVCTTTTLVSGTSTQFRGLTYTDPAGSSTNTAFTQGTPGSAVVADSVGFPGAWNTAAADPDVSGSSWINDSATPPTNPAGAGGDGTVDSWRLFTDSVNVPATAIISSAILHLTADNSVLAYLDHVPVGSATDYTVVNDLPLTITPGSHELEFVVKNDAYNGPNNPTGVIYRADINYCVPVPPPVVDCPAAPSIAAAYLKEKGVKAGSDQYKNVISLVAQHMGPQTFFDGVGACNSAYANTVKAYVDAKLAAPTPKK